MRNSIVDLSLEESFFMQRVYLTVLLLSAFIRHIHTLFFISHPFRQHLSTLRNYIDRAMEDSASSSSDLSGIQLVSSEQLSDSVIGAKSLVWADEESLPYMLVLAVERKVSTDKLFTASKKAFSMSDRETAELLTRQRIGSISPFGHHDQFQIIVDSQLLDVGGPLQWVAVGSGIEGSSYCLTIEKLIALTNAQVIDISVEDLFMKARAASLTAKNRSNQAVASRSDFAGLQFSPQLLRKLAISSDTVKLIATIDAAKRCVFASEYSFPKHFTLKDHLDLPSKVGGKTALHLAAWKGPIENVRVLIEHGASVNQYSTNIGNYGKTALFYAITQCRDSMVLELLRHQALVIIVNNKGQTPRSLGVSHLKEETLAAIEAAEKQQLVASNNEFMNFYATHRDHEGSYGDLDPRFVDEAKDLREQCAVDELPKSILMTTVTTRRGKHNSVDSLSHQNNQEMEHHSRTEHFLSTFSPHFADYPDEGRLANITNIIHPVINTTVELKAMIIAKRQISKFLVFVNICPINLSNFSSFLGMRYSWEDDFGHESRDMYAIQLIIGKSLKNILGEDLLSALCKYIKEGQKVYIRGEIRAITLGKRPLPSQVLYSQNESFAQADNLREIDLAVTQLLFLDDCTPSNGVVLDTNSVVSSGTSITTLSSGATTSVVEAMKKMRKNESRLVYQDDEEFDFGEYVKTRVQNETDNNHEQEEEGEEYDDINEAEEANSNNTAVVVAPILPFLQLEDFASSLHLSSSTTYDATVTLVNDQSTLDHFITVLHSLTAIASQSLSLPTAVMGIDCEWQPEGLYDVSSHHYVQTLQIGTKLGLFILDMTTLARNTKLSVKLNSELEIVMQDESIRKIGYDCRQDFERLAASFPTFTCFQRVLTVIDLQPLARQLYPGKVMKKDLGLSRLCAVLLGKVLNKKQQCSPWHIRPLTSAQITYAALDVASLIMLFDTMMVDYQHGALSSLVSGKKKNRLTFEEETFTMLLKRLSMIFNLKFAVQEVDELTRNTLDDKVMKQSNMRLLFDRLLRFKKWTAHAGVEPTLSPVSHCFYPYLSDD